MTSPITGPTPVADTARTSAGVPALRAKDAHDKNNHGLAEAGREFEAIFVRSMLKETPLAKKGDSYGDMAIDAVAKSITAGKGLGLGELIKRAVETIDNRTHSEQKALAPLKNGT